MAKLSDDLKESLSKGFDLEMERLSRPLNVVWTVGNGRQYQTKQEAEIVCKVINDGGVNIDWVLDDNKRVIALERLVDDNEIVKLSDKQYPVITYKIGEGKPKITYEEPERKPISMDDIRFIDEVLKEDNDAYS